MHRYSSLLFTLLLLSIPASAGEPGKDKRPEPGTTVEMPFLVAPMSQDGKLLGYAYISSKLLCSSPSACIDVREKLAFIQDANVRDVNARPIAQAKDPIAVDRDLLNARMTANAKRIVGDNKVVNMVFGDIKYSPLHPSESTAGMTSSGPAEGVAGANAAGAASAQAPAPSQPAATSKPPAKQAQ